MVHKMYMHIQKRLWNVNIGKIDLTNRRLHFRISISLAHSSQSVWWWESFDGLTKYTNKMPSKQQFTHHSYIIIRYEEAIGILDGSHFIGMAYTLQKKYRKINTHSKCKHILQIFSKAIVWIELLATNENDATKRVEMDDLKLKMCAVKRRQRKCPQFVRDSAFQKGDSI